MIGNRQDSPLQPPWAAVWNLLQSLGELLLRVGGDLHPSSRSSGLQTACSAERVNQERLLLWFCGRNHDCQEQIFVVHGVLLKVGATLLVNEKLKTLIKARL